MRLDRCGRDDPGPPRAGGRDHDYIDEKILYIWAGHVDHSAPDLLAVNDFDETLPGNGKVINVVPLPGPLSVLSGPPGIFFFDTTRRTTAVPLLLGRLGRWSTRH